jgi:hypothetical protein
MVALAPWRFRVKTTKGQIGDKIRQVQLCTNTSQRRLASSPVAWSQTTKAKVNGLMAEQQNDTTKARRTQFAQTPAISHPSCRIMVSGEIWHYAQSLTNR